MKCGPEKGNYEIIFQDHGTKEQDYSSNMETNKAAVLHGHKESFNMLSDGIGIVNLDLKQIYVPIKCITKPSLQS